MSGDLVYFQIDVSDAEKGKAFYGALFGWEVEPGSVAEGYQFSGPTPPGGMFAGGETAARPLPYFDVDDLEAALEQVRSLGGDAGDPQETGGGRFAICSDDQGVEFGIWQGES